MLNFKQLLNNESMATVPSLFLLEASRELEFNRININELEDHVAECEDEIQTLKNQRVEILESVMRYVASQKGYYSSYESRWCFMEDAKEFLKTIGLNEIKITRFEDLMTQKHDAEKEAQ